ncbi:MAG TPA: DUF481 domain-containing protein [Kofleriaceae bacterium]|nr:DUF481 domain-containing protein [Kofleriaceae bacterium]
MSRSWLVIAVAIVLSLALALGPGVAQAQIVNVQAALAKPPEHDDQAGQVEGKITWREGNNPLFDLGGAGSLVVRRSNVLGLIVVRGEYGTSAGTLLTKKTFEHIRIRSLLDGGWRWEVFAQHEYDQFRRLSLRAVTGTGPAYQLVDTKPIVVLAGAAYIYEDERLDTRAGTIDAGVHSVAHRISAYVTGHESVGAGAAIIETVYAQPRIDDPGDIRILGELSVQSKLSSRIALKDSFNVAYDRTPPDRVKPYDTALEASVIVTF